MNDISAIITTHNRASLVANAIESVLKQTFKNFELLIIDDASKDNTEEIVKTFTDDKIKYIKIRQEDSKGGNYARNIGIKEAKGEFIAFLDDDDEWLPEKLEKQLEVFKKDRNIGLVHTGLLYVSGKEKIFGKYIPSKRGDLSKDILIDNLIIGPTSSIMAKKIILEQVGLFDIKMPAHQDYDICIRLCQICNVDFVEEALLKIYEHGNIRIANSLEKYEKSISLINKKYNDLILDLDKKSKRQREFNIYRNFLSCKFDSSNRKKFKIYGTKALMIKFNLKIFIKLCFALFGIYDLTKIKRYFWQICKAINIFYRRKINAE